MLVLRCCAVCCSRLYYVAVCCSVFALQLGLYAHMLVLRRVAVSCYVLQRVAVCYSVLQCVCSPT